jgi:cell division inhibitor SepF
MAEESYSTEIATLIPGVFDDVKIAADKIKQGVPVLVNVSRLTTEERLWALHFLNGVVYAMNGRSRDIGNKVFLFTPPNIEVNIEETP